MRQRANTYIRRDIAGVYLERYDQGGRTRAKDEGYDLARTIVDGPEGRGMEQLFRLISEPDADTVVILPSLRHIPDTPLDDLLEYADVLTLSPCRRWTKRTPESTPAKHLLTRLTPKVSQETQDVAAVAAMRESIAEAERRFREAAGK